MMSTRQSTWLPSKGSAFHRLSEISRSQIASDAMDIVNRMSLAFIKITLIMRYVSITDIYNADNVSYFRCPKIAQMIFAFANGKGINNAPR